MRQRFPYKKYERRHIYIVSKQHLKLSIVSGNSRRQAIIWPNARIWIIGKKYRWNLKRKSYILNTENAFENVVCQMAAILTWPQCVNSNIRVIHSYNHELFTISMEKSALHSYCHKHYVLNRGIKHAHMAILPMYLLMGFDQYWQ